MKRQFRCKQPVYSLCNASEWAQRTCHRFDRWPHTPDAFGQRRRCARAFLGAFCKLSQLNDLAIKDIRRNNVVKTAFYFWGSPDGCAGRVQQSESRSKYGPRRDLDNSGAQTGAQTGAIGADRGQEAAPDPLNDPNSPLAQRSIYFGFNRYDLAEEDQSLLLQHARYLKEHSQRRILIQGNTDERGTSEYNLALGQKRAEAVRRALALMGVNGEQMEAVSLGKEKPQAFGHDEAAWSQNRRADIVYQ